VLEFGEAEPENFGCRSEYVRGSILVGGSFGFSFYDDRWGFFSGNLCSPVFGACVVFW